MSPAIRYTMMNESSPAIQPQRLRKLLHRLIDIYSPSGKEEEIIDFLHGYLNRRGLPVISQLVDGSRHNLLVIPPETDIRLALIGHVDTVMAYDLDNYGYEEEDDLIIGLGAADMKGGCAAMIEAYLTLWESGCSELPVALVLVVGEEEEGDGSQKLAKEFYFPWAIIGEPTNLQPCLSHFGYLEVELTTRGRRIHASLANMIKNPIESMLHLLLKISHYVESEHPEMVFNIRELSNAQAGFAVPDRCDAWLDLHLPPTAPIGEITLELEQILVRERQQNRDFDGTLRFATIHAGYELPEQWPMVETLKAVYDHHTSPWQPQPFRSHSDANLLWAAGVKPILLGPGQLEKAHAPDESVSFQQVLTATQYYLDLMLWLCT